MKAFDFSVEIFLQFSKNHPLIIRFQSIVVTQNYVACRLEKHFNSPLKFIPERWLKIDGKTPKINPHLVLPFSHGIRACIARRFAEQNMLVLMIRVRLTLMPV